MRLTEIAEIRASMCKPNMDRLMDFVMSKPTGYWRLSKINSYQNKGEP